MILDLKGTQSKVMVTIQKHIYKNSLLFCIFAGILAFDGVTQNAHVLRKRCIENYFGISFKMQWVKADAQDDRKLLCIQSFPNEYFCFGILNYSKAGFSYDNSVSLQTDDAGHVGAAVLAYMVCIVGLYTNDVRHNWKGL